MGEALLPPTNNTINMQVTNEYTELMMVLKNILKELKCQTSVLTDCCNPTPQWYDLGLQLATPDASCVDDLLSLRYWVVNAGSITIPTGTEITVYSSVVISAAVIPGGEATINVGFDTVTLTADLIPGDYFSLSLSYDVEDCEAPFTVTTTLTLVELPEEELTNNTVTFNSEV